MIKIRESIKNLFPAYFALVMSTGIISIAGHFLGYHFISEALFILNNAAYFILLLFLLLRLLLFPRHLVNDIASHARGAGFFTLVAGTSILGVQYTLLEGNMLMGGILWYFALGAWIILIYAFLLAVTVKHNKPSLEDGMNGIWLIIVVATQSIAILSILLKDHLAIKEEVVAFIALSFFVLGAMLYIILITLIFLRLTFYPVKAEQFAPPYWINMGAVAISTLAGSVLLLSDTPYEWFNSFSPFIKGFSLFFWATATWWIPAIVFLGIWRHIYKKFPLRYHPQYWGMVFPLGMYTTCTWQLAEALNTPFIKIIPTYFIYLAFVAWLVTFGGMLYDITRYIIKKPAE